MGKHKTWEELELKNDFLFAKVMRNPELCKEMLETLLELKIDRIEYPEEQKTIDITNDARSVRLDIYVQDDKNTVYNVEIQTTDTLDLPKRSRYYQGMIDLNLIEKGEYFKKLNTSYVIFICTFDPFKKGLSKYTFKNMCMEDKDTQLNDGTVKMFFNTKSSKNDISKEAKSFLDYVDGKESDDEFVKKLKKEVEKIKGNEEWRREYMTLMMRDQENLEKGRMESAKVIARNLIMNGVDDAVVIQSTGLSQEEFEEIKKTMSCSE